ncbi:uncharacterized protein LOC135466881 [Liolophura sinensis]|uniref:uncharacterized protein LOC135466881 n=1 Tax=Liolophura sinensis TaxID=3198878 RepID=UPI00315963F3
MKAIFLTASLCCSVYTTNASIPSNLTKVEYYTNIFSWNEAYDICNRSGGSLLQPETRLEWDYYRSVIRELSVMAVRCLATTRDPPTIDGTSTPLSTTAYSLSVTSSHTVVPGNKASITGKSQTDMTSVSMTRAGLPTGTSDVPTTMGVFSIPTAEDNKPATSATIVRIPLLLPQGPASPNSVATKEATATAETASTTETTEITTATATKEIATSTAATQTATTTATMESATTTTTTTETAATTATTETTITSATPTSTSVTTALRTTPPKTNSSRQLCSCPCVQHPIRPQIITKAKFTDNLIAKLEINKTNLSSTRRKLISVYESRVVPMALGTCGLGILLSIYGVILLSDIVPHFKKLTVKALSDNNRSMEIWMNMILATPGQRHVNGVVSVLCDLMTESSLAGVVSCQLTVNEDDGASSLGDQYPNTPCFNSSISEKATTSRPFTTSSSAKPRTYWMSSQSARPNPSVALTSTRDSYSVEPVSTTQWTPIISTTVPSETSAKQSKVTEASSSLNHLITTESSTSAIITTTRKPTCWCPCGRIIAKKNITKQKFIEELVQGLEISKANLSSNRRRRSSVYERRAVPVTLGSVWVGVLLALYGVVLFSDIFLHGKSSMTASSRGYGYGKRKVRPIEENTNTPSKP